MVVKPSIAVILNPGPFCWKASKKEILQANSKKILNIGYAITVRAGCVKFIFKTLNFYNVK